MASVRKEAVLEAEADTVWAALREPLAVARLFDGDARVVTFANGLVVRERIITVDDASRRIAYAVVEGSPTHHNASMQVFSEAEGRSRFVWISDFLPDELAATIGPLMDQGVAALTRAFEPQSAGA